ncbi:hypothetical protein Unana1_07517 [Umbelopsis nana]
MLAYSIYKHNKEKKAAAAAAAEAAAASSTSADKQSELYHKLEHEDSFTPVEGEMEVGMLPRTGTQATFKTVKSKNLQMRQWLMLGLSMFVDVILPIILYYTLRNTLSQLAALLISSAPPAALVVFKVLYYRTVDPLGVIIVFGFVLSAIISVIDGNPRVLLLRESIVTGATGLIFLITLIPLKIGKIQLKPLIYGVTEQMMSILPPVEYVYKGEVIKQTRMEFCWQWSREFKKGTYILTAAWGVILFLEFVAKLIMYFSSITVDQMVLYGNIVLGVTLGTMGVVNIIYSRIIRLRTIKETTEVQKRLEDEAEQYQTYLDEA